MRLRWNFALITAVAVFAGLLMAPTREAWIPAICWALGLYTGAFCMLVKFK